MPVLTLLFTFYRSLIFTTSHPTIKEAKWLAIDIINLIIKANQKVLATMPVYLVVSKTPNN